MPHTACRLCRADVRRPWRSDSVVLAGQPSCVYCPKYDCDPYLAVRHLERRLAQAAAILAATNGLGLLASHVGPTASIVAASGACALAGAVVLATPSLRAAALPYVGRAEGQPE